MEMTLVDKEFEYNRESVDEAETGKTLEVKGCFLDKNTFSLHMFEEKLSINNNNKVGKNF